MTNETERCPQCGGHAEAFAVMCGPRTPGGEDMKCTTAVVVCELCSGLGIVDSAVAERYRRGRAIMEKRKKTGPHRTPAGGDSAYESNAAQRY